MRFFAGCAALPFLPFAAIAAVVATATPLAAQAPAHPLDKWGQMVSADQAERLKRAVLASATNFADAENQFNELLAQDPRYYGAQYNLGLLLLQNDARLGDAVTHLKLARQIAQDQSLNAPTVCGELAFAEYRSDRAEDATRDFKLAVEKNLHDMEPDDQLKLLERATVFFLDYQDPASAIKLLKKAEFKQPDPKVLRRAQVFLKRGIAQMTAHDVDAGWMCYGKLVSGSGDADARYFPTFFRKIDRRPGAKPDKTAGMPVDDTPGAPIKGGLVTPSTSVNIRAEKPDPANQDGTLAPWVGTARVGERFELLDDPQIIHLPTGPALWMHALRLPSPVD